MRKTIIGSVLIAACVLVQVAPAQEGRVEYVYATYFVCSPDGESRADEIINTSYKPHYDAAVEHGDISAWVWMQHYMGGNWRRVLLIVAPDTDSLLDASGALGEIIEDRTPEAGRAFSAICSSHEDYIWQTTPGIGTGSATQDRGGAGLTSYYQCDTSRLDRADELVREVFGPVLDAQVGDGRLSSWGWAKRDVGGKVSRILVLGASDHKTLMRVWHAVEEELQGRKFERPLREIRQICHTREDYMWDILS